MFPHSGGIVQLWDETEPGLPSGEVVGIPGFDLYLHQKERRYIQMDRLIIDVTLMFKKKRGKKVVVFIFSVRAPRLW